MSRACSASCDGGTPAALSWAPVAGLSPACAAGAGAEGAACGAAAFSCPATGGFSGVCVAETDGVDGAVTGAADVEAAVVGGLTEPAAGDLASPRAFAVTGAAGSWGRK